MPQKWPTPKRLREGGKDQPIHKTEAALTTAQIKECNDKQRFQYMLENSMSSVTLDGDLDTGFYLTESQEEANANALFRGVTQVYKGDPALTTPFADLVCIKTLAPLGKGGMKRFVPWEGSRTNASGDYLLVVTNPRPKISKQRTTMG